jgi:hypothetical protein
MPTNSRSKTQKSNSRSMTRKSNSRSKTRKSLGLSHKEHIIKTIELKNEMRKLRVDTYMKYTRNAKYLLKFGSIPHLRMYRTLKNEHQMFRDFIREYPHLGMLQKLFSKYNLMTLQEMRATEQKIKEETERIRLAAEAEMREHEKQRFRQMQYINKQFETHLATQREKDETISSLMEENDKFKTLYRQVYADNVVSREDQQRMMDQIDKLLAEIKLQDQIIHEYKDRAEMDARFLDRKNDAINDLLNTVSKLENKIKDMYVYDMVQQGISFVSRFVSKLEEIGSKYDRETKQNIREGLERAKQRKEAMAKEAEELKRQMEEDAKRQEEQRRQEEEEQRRQEEHRRQEEEMQRRQEEQKRQEEELKRRQEERKHQEENHQSRRQPSANLGVMRDKIIAESKKLLKDVSKYKDKRCAAAKVDIPSALPPCQDENSNTLRKTVKKQFMKTHPDKPGNEDCKEYANSKTQLLGLVKEYLDALKEC